MDVLIVEDDCAMQTYLRNSVESLSVVEQVHLASSAKSGLETLQHQTIGLLLCDLGLPDGDGVELIREASARNIPSLVISIKCDEVTVLKAVESGANGYLLKDNNPPQIQAAILELLDGGAPISPSIAAHLLSRVREQSENDAAQRPDLELSVRETEVLKLIARGYKITEIANILNISHHTVGNHNRSVYKKLKVNSRSQAVFVAMQRGLVSKDQ